MLAQVSADHTTATKFRLAVMLRQLVARGLHPAHAFRQHTVMRHQMPPRTHAPGLSRTFPTLLSIAPWQRD